MHKKTREGMDSTLAGNCFKPKMIARMASPGVPDRDVGPSIPKNEERWKCQMNFQILTH